MDRRERRQGPAVGRPVVTCLTMTFLSFSVALADVPEQVASLKSSVLFVTVTTESGGQTTQETGSGFIITASGYALTANHLIAAANSKVHVSVGSRFNPAIPAAVI